MQYATVDDFVELFSIDLDGTPDYPISAIDKQNAINQIVLALSNATAEIRMYTASRYGPDANAPYFKYACCVIARKSIDLYNDREKVRTDYDDVISKLKQIAAGTLTLTGASGKPLTPIDEVTNPKSRVHVVDRATGAKQINF